VARSQQEHRGRAGCHDETVGGDDRLLLTGMRAAGDEELLMRSDSEIGP
jgi:hypothetical protein